MKIYHRFIIIILTIFIVLPVSIMIVYGYGGGSSTGGEDSYGNVFKYETMIQSLIFNQSVKYPFITPELSIYEILINGKNNEPDISAKVEDLINTSEYANRSPPGVVYRNENVWIGTDRINYITVRFRVNNSWMNSNSLNDSHYPHLLKWNGETWLVLKTDIISKNGTYTYFESPKAGSTSTSIFAISAEELLPNDIMNSSVPVATNIVDINPVPINESMVKRNDYGKLEIGTVAIVIVLVFYMLRIKKT